MAKRANAKRAQIVKTLASQRSKRKISPPERYGFSTSPRQIRGDEKQSTKEQSRSSSEKDGAASSKPSPKSGHNAARPSSSVKSSSSGLFVTWGPGSPSPEIKEEPSSSSSFKKSGSPSIKKEPTIPAIKTESSSRRTTPNYGTPSISIKSESIKTEPSFRRSVKTSSSQGIKSSPYHSPTDEAGFQPDWRQTLWQEDHAQLSDPRRGNIYFGNLFASTDDVDALWRGFIKRYRLRPCGCTIPCGHHYNTEREWLHRFRALYMIYHRDCSGWPHDDFEPTKE